MAYAPRPPSSSALTQWIASGSLSGDAGLVEGVGGGHHGHDARLHIAGAASPRPATVVDAQRERVVVGPQPQVARWHDVGVAVQGKGGEPARCAADADAADRPRALDLHTGEVRTSRLRSDVDVPGVDGEAEPTQPVRAPLLGVDLLRATVHRGDGDEVGEVREQRVGVDGLGDTSFGLGQGAHLGTMAGHDNGTTDPCVYQIADGTPRMWCHHATAGGRAMSMFSAATPTRRGWMRAVTVVAATMTLPVLVAAPGLARPAWDTSPVKVVRQVHPAAKVVDLRVGEHKNFDRVVIDVRGDVPGYTVRYVHKLTYDASGKPVRLKGKRFIAIALTPAKAENAKGRSLYHGPRLQQYRMPSLRGVAFTGDFEGVVSFGLSLRHRDDFRVSELSSPSRLVIDLQH